jgi:L-threonylcarbamoyladenylate synthase
MMPPSNTPYNTQLMQANAAAIDAAAALIFAGHCVAVPTETVYGLAADATSAAAVAAIYAAKGRPAFNPLIVHVADVAMAERLALFDDKARALATTFWPGPLTLVLPRRADAELADAVTAGLPTVALRCPAHPVMRALIAAAGCPLAAPSANASGGVSPTEAAHVLQSLAGRIPLILDAGPCAAGIESTIVATGPSSLTLLRPGPISAETLIAATGLPVVAHSGEVITAPGQLASHYAPGKPMLLDCAIPPADCFMIGFGAIGGDVQLSEAGDLGEAAQGLYAALHAGAASGRGRIAVAPIPHAGIGAAINDRLRRAAA